MIKRKRQRDNNRNRFSRSYLIAEIAGEKRFVYWAFGLSFACHIGLFGGVLAAQFYKPKKPIRPSVINVSLVALPEKAAQSGPTRNKTAPVSKKKTSKKKETRKKSVTVKTKPKKKQPVVSTSGKQKVSLKKKTFKSAKVKKSALEKIEKKVEKASTEQLATALDKLKTKVEERESEELSQVREEPTQQSTATEAEGTGQGGRIGELIDIYRVEIAYQIQKNWAFPSQLAGGRSDLQTMLVFKVMPNGDIEDLFFTDRSGNSHFDESAYRAVMKTNPVDPHPAGLIRAYVQMGLRFTPEGVK